MRQSSALVRVIGSLRVDWRIVFAVVAGLLAGGLSLLFLYSKTASAVTPTGFTDELLTKVGSPTALAFTPDGRMLVTTAPGTLRVYKDGALLPNPALDISGKVCTNGGRGLVGVAVDPNFATNHYIYLYYTFKKHGVCEQNTSRVPVNRVQRYRLNDSNIAAPDTMLVDNIPNMTQHNGGDLHFGKDGYLYITVGDGGCDYAGNSGCAGQNDAAQDLHALVGKILRVTRDGGIPATNPYTGTGSARCNVDGGTDVGKKCQEIFASGLRNPFRFAFDPNASGTRFFINDVGEARWEEVSEGRSGANYAWNLCEGNHDNPNRQGSVNCSAAPYTPPVHEYSHLTGCSSITGAAFVPNGVWPAGYDNSYLYGDYVCGKIFKLTPNGAGGFTQEAFVTGLGENSAVAMTFGPHQGSQALYYTTYGGNGPGSGGVGGEVRRIAYTGNTNRAPSASVKTTSPNYGKVPLTVSFDGSGSTDPDGDTPLTYQWDFGDGTAPTETTTPTTDHTYTTVPTDSSNSYEVTLKVRDARGMVSAPATVEVFPGNEAPAPLIDSPSANLLYSVDEQITLSGSANDPEDGQLAGTSLSWEVLQHHNGTHTHPYFSQTGNNRTITAPMPEGLDATGAGNYLEVRLTATDSKGLSQTVTREIQPNRVDVSFATNVAKEPRSGLSLLINGQKFTTPKTLLSWEGYKLNVNVPSPQTLDGKPYVFSSWSDGEGKQHNIVTEATASTYTATFKGCTKSGTSAAETLSGTSAADIICGLGGSDTIEGLGGDDILLGGGGADKVKGNSGADILYGEDGNDALNSRDGVSGNDSLNGGAGTDTRVTDRTEMSILGFP
jgi:glucose/arabinose dehydrogenase